MSGKNKKHTTRVVSQHIYPFSTESVCVCVCYYAFDWEYQWMRSCRKKRITDFQQRWIFITIEQRYTYNISTHFSFRNTQWWCGWGNIWHLCVYFGWSVLNSMCRSYCLFIRMNNESIQHLAMIRTHTRTHSKYIENESN